MNTTAPEPPPRRKWRLKWWFALLWVVFAAYFGWKEYDFRAAIKEAEALGWGVIYTDPLETIQENWKATFETETWQNAVPRVGIWGDEQPKQHHKLLCRLNPRMLDIRGASALRDFTILDGLTRLEALYIIGSISLTSLDSLKNLRTLESLQLSDCPALTNFDALSHLPALRYVALERCPGLTNLTALNNHPALKAIYLNNCDGLLNVDTLKKAPALEILHLDLCTNLTNIEALKNLPTLKEIWLRRCPGVSKESITALKAALPNTVIEAD
jgi:hypothetical protein